MSCKVCNGTGTVKGYQRQSLSHYAFTCQRCFGSGVEQLGVSYAGIGSRETPIAIAQQMGNFAVTLALKGWTLRSGGGKRPAKASDDTDSADLAFERGCDIVKGRKVIRTTTHGEAALEHASRYHPNWQACDEYAQGLHARNSLVMCGDLLDDPVRFVVCYTEGGKVKGGTGQALRIAQVLSIPVYNLAFAEHIEALREWLK